MPKRVLKNVEEKKPKRKIAPSGVMFQFENVDERTKIAKMAVPQAFGDDATMSVYYSEANPDVDDLKRRGFEPVMRQGGGQVNHKGDLLWVRNRAASLKERERPELMSKAMVSSVFRAERPEDRAAGLQVVNE